MKILRIYKEKISNIQSKFNKILHTRTALWVLALDSFAESLIWPIPPAIFLAPLCAAFPCKKTKFALIVTLSGEIGNVIMFVLGIYLSVICIDYYIYYGGDLNTLNKAIEFTDNCLFPIAPAAAAFIPIPYKISCFALGLFAKEKYLLEKADDLFEPLAIFLISSTTGRFVRFYIEAIIFSYGYKIIHHRLKK
jgi:membrane protein YqaA with SNARE-associated domain